MMRRALSAAATCLFLSFQAVPAVAGSLGHWSQLTPAQQRILKPLATQWDALPAKLKQNLLQASEDYKNLTPEQQKRFQSRLEKWSRLTPEQRKRAREKFEAFSKVSPEKREAVKKMVREQEAGSKHH